MKKLSKKTPVMLSLVLCIAIMLCGFTVFADDSHINDSQDYKDALKAAETYLGLDGIDDLITPDGTDLDRLEIKLGIPHMNINSFLTKGMTPLAASQAPIGYTFVVYSGDSPVSTIEIVRRDGVMKYFSSGGDAQAFMDNYNKINEFSIDGLVVLVVNYTSAFDFYTQTENGNVIMPARMYDDENLDSYRKSAGTGDVLLIAQDDFEVMHKQATDVFNAELEKGNRYLGGSGYYSYLPKTIHTAGEEDSSIVVVILVGSALLIVGGFIGFVTYRKRKHIKKTD